VKGVNLAWTQPYRDDRFFLDGSGTIAQPIPNGLATVTGTINGEWFDNTFYNGVPVRRVRVAGYHVRRADGYRVDVLPDDQVHAERHPDPRHQPAGRRAGPDRRRHPVRGEG
jgi:hypothetical protein